MLDRLEQLVPELNSRSPAFNETKAVAFQAVVDGLIGRGMSPTEALRATTASFYRVDLPIPSHAGGVSAAPLGAASAPSASPVGRIEDKFPPRSAADQACLDQYHAAMGSVSNDLPLGEYVAIRERNERRLAACMGR